MTMKHQERNISAENEEVFIGASLSTEGILTFNKKNFYDETTGTFVINLNKIKLRLIPLENKQQLDAIKNSNDPDIIEQRNSHIYLVPFSEQDVEEGIYRECVWVESKHDFEVLGSTKVDLEPIQLDISRLKNILEFEIVEENGTVTIKSNRLDDIEDELDRLEEVKVDKVPGKQLSTEDYTTAEKNKLAGIENEANKYIHPSYAAKTGKPTANQTPGFGGNVTISQITSDNKGHVTGAVDRIITIPSTPASATTNGLAKATSTNPSDVNLSSNNVGTNNNEFARADHVHKHPNGVSKTGQPTSNQTPGFGDTFKVTQFTSNATGHISGATDRNITIPATEATTSTHGLMSASDKTKLDGIAPGAGHLTIDNALNENSTNPVQNAVICREFYTKEDIINLLNSIETGRGKLLTIYVDETTGDLVIQDNGLEYYTEDEVDDLFLTKTDANTQYTIGLEKQGTADTGDISTYVVKQGGTSLSPKIKIPKNLSEYTNDIGFLTQHQSLANYIQKSQTSGLVKNDGTIDTNTYLTQHQSLDSKTVTLEKQQTAEAGYIATYVIKQGNVALSPKINIPKDFLVKSATLETCSTANSPQNGLAVGDKYIDFVINTKDNSGTNEHIYLNVKDLVDVYTADERTLTLNNGQFSIKRGVIPTKTSNLINDGDGTNNFLTQHQSLSNYIQKSNTNGLIKNDGTIDTNTYLTQHQDISGKQNTLVSGTNIKTINNQSILGSGNITVSTNTIHKDTITPSDIASYLQFDQQYMQNRTKENFMELLENETEMESIEDALLDYIETEYIFDGSEDEVAFMLFDITDWENDNDYEYYTYHFSIENGSILYHIPKIADNLTTNDATKVLSAKQGKVLKDLIGDAVSYINQGGSS